MTAQFDVVKVFFFTIQFFFFFFFQKERGKKKKYDPRNQTGDDIINGVCYVLLIFNEEKKTRNTKKKKKQQTTTQSVSSTLGVSRLPAPDNLCGYITVVQSDTCPHGTEALPLNILQSCYGYICSYIISQWEIARGADESMMLYGLGYQCKLKHGTFNGTTLCQPIPTPPPPPAPTSHMCGYISVINNKTCPFGTEPIPLNVLKSCSDYICTYVLSGWEIAGGADPSVSLYGPGYGCYLKDGPRSEATLCRPHIPTPPPTPTPSLNSCGDLSIVRGDCPSHLVPAFLSQVELCRPYICNHLLDTYDMAKCATSGKRITGNGFGCHIETYDFGNVEFTICQPFTTPIPTPAPIPSMCLPLIVADGYCPEGSVPALLSAMDICSTYICENLMGNWDVAKGYAPNVKLLGKVFGCFLQSYNDSDTPALTICERESSSLSSSIPDEFFISLSVYFITVTLVFIILIFIFIVGRRQRQDVVIDDEEIEQETFTKVI